MRSWSEGQGRIKIVRNSRKKTFIIKNKLGLHARAANLIVQVASRFESDITVEKNGVEANGKSIMGLLLLAATQGTEIVVKARGHDADEALDALEKVVSDGFGER